MDILFIILTSLGAYHAMTWLRMRQWQERSRLALRDVEMLLGERARQVSLLEQQLRGLVAFPNAALVQAVADVSTYLLKTKKSLNERLTDEVRLSKLILSAKEAVAEPIVGMDFVMREQVAKSLKEIAECEESARVLVGMAQGMVQAHSRTAKQFPWSMLPPRWVPEVVQVPLGRF